MEKDPFKYFAPQPDEPHFSWEEYVSNHWDLKDLSPYIEGDLVSEDKYVIETIESLNGYKDAFCETKRDREELAEVFPDIDPAIVVYLLYTGDNRTQITKQLPRTNPSVVSKIIDNNAAMKIAGGAGTLRLFQQDEDFEFMGDDSDLASIGRVTLLTDILMNDNPKAAEIVNSAADNYTDELAIAAIQAYASDWPQIMSYENSNLLRLAVFQNPLKEIEFSQAVKNAEHPLFANVEIGDDESSGLKFAADQFRFHRMNLLSKLDRLSIHSNPN